MSIDYNRYTFEPKKNNKERLEVLYYNPHYVKDFKK